MGVRQDREVFDIADAAEAVVAPAMPAECLLDCDALIMVCSWVHTSFLKHAIRQSERYGVPAHQLLHRAGRRKLIGGQEDQLIDIALEIKLRKWLVLGVHVDDRRRARTAATFGSECRAFTGVRHNRLALGFAI